MPPRRARTTSSSSFTMVSPEPSSGAPGFRGPIKPGPGQAAPPAGRTPAASTILRNALHYTVSAREYAALQRYFSSRSRLLRRRADSPGVSPSGSQGGEPAGRDSGSGSGSGSGAAGLARLGDDYNARAVRHALRVLVVGLLGMQTLKTILSRRFPRRNESPITCRHSLIFRLPLSLATILLVYRLLFRFFVRLRLQLLTPSASPFCRRNPRTVAALTCRYTPAAGAALAGLALGISPPSGLRRTIALWSLFRALEWTWNLAEAEGFIWGWSSNQAAKGTRVLIERPWWFGSWLLQPLAMAQLLHAIVLDRDCVPEPIHDLIFKFTPSYANPSDFSPYIRWPVTSEVLDDVAQMARLGWPRYISQTLFPNAKPIPDTIKAVGPLTSTAHPLITSLSCAALHPSEPSCARTYLAFWLRVFPPTARVFFLLYAAASVLPVPTTLYHAPFYSLQRVVSRSVRSATFVTGVASTAWASVCMFQSLLPRHVLSTRRLYVGGFLAGLWAWLERRHGQVVALYLNRVAVESLWRVGVKRGWWKTVRGGDVYLFVLALALAGTAYDRSAAKAIRSPGWRKGVSWARGEGWRDWGMEEEEGADEEDEEAEKDDG